MKWLLIAAIHLFATNGNEINTTNVQIVYEREEACHNELNYLKLMSQQPLTVSGNCVQQSNGS